MLAVWWRSPLDLDNTSTTTEPSVGKLRGLQRAAVSYGIADLNLRHSFGLHTAPNKLAARAAGGLGLWDRCCKLCCRSMELLR